MPSESLSHLAKPADKPKKPTPSQEEIRAILQKKLLFLMLPLKDGAKEFEQALKDGLFEDQDDEPDGSGEARRTAMEQKLTAMADRAKKLKTRIDSKEPLLPQAQDIQVNYTYTNPQTNKVEHQETITLDIEQKLQEFLSFYKTTHLDLPPDFEDTTRDIWERNYDDIQEAIEQNGFNDILIIPGAIPLPDLKDKMSMENGYFEGNNFKQGGSFAGAKSQNTDKPCILLVHKTDKLLEITQKTGLDVHLNCTGQEAEQLYQQHPDHYLGTLPALLILERKYFADTGKHVSDWNNKSAHWLPGTKSGSRLVNVYWNPDDHKLVVSAGDPGYQASDLGVRPSRCFF